MNNNFMGYFNPPPGSMNSGPGFPAGNLGPQGSFTDVPVNLGGMLGPTNGPQQRLSHYESMQLAQVQSAGSQPRLQAYMGLQQSGPFGAVPGLSSQGLPQYDMRMPSQGQDPLNLQSNSSFLNSMQQWPRMPNAVLRHKQMMMQQNMEQNLTSIPSNEEIAFGSPQSFQSAELLNYPKIQSQDEPQPLQRQSSVYSSFPFGPQPFGSRVSIYQSYDPPRLQQSSAAIPTARRQSSTSHFGMQQNPLHEAQLSSNLPHTQSSLFRSSIPKSFSDDISNKVQPQSTGVPHSPKLSHFGPSPNTSVFDIPGSQQRIQKIPRFQQSPPFGGNEIGKGISPGLGSGMQGRLQPDSSPVMTPPRVARLPSPSRMSSPTKVSPLLMQMQQIQQRICQLQESGLPQAATHIAMLQQQYQTLYRQSLLQKSNTDYARPPSIPNDDRSLSSQMSPLQAMSMQLSPLHSNAMQHSPMSSSSAQHSPMTSLKRPLDETNLLDFPSIPAEPGINLSPANVNDLSMMRRTSPPQPVGRLNDNAPILDGKENSNSLSSIAKMTSISNMVDLSSSPSFDSFPQTTTYSRLTNDSDFSTSSNIPLTQLSNLAEEIGMSKIQGSFDSEKESENVKIGSENDSELLNLEKLDNGGTGKAAAGPESTASFASHGTDNTMPSATIGPHGESGGTKSKGTVIQQLASEENKGGTTQPPADKDPFPNQFVDGQKQGQFEPENFCPPDRAGEFLKKANEKASEGLIKQMGSQGLFPSASIFGAKHEFENGSTFDVGQPFDEKNLFDSESFFDSKEFLEGDPGNMFDKRDLLDGGLQLEIEKPAPVRQPEKVVPSPVVTSSDVVQHTPVIHSLQDKPKPKGKTIKNIPGAKIFGSGKGKGKGGGKGKNSGKNSGKGRQRKTAGSGKKRKSSDSESFASPPNSPSLLTSETAEAMDLDLIKRRSLRERRKKNYRDDFDYNLSDEDDLKKKKGDIPPDGHKLIPYKPSEAVEGEIAIVEKILATRIRHLMGEDGKQVEEPEYFVKYKGYSYLHCEWGTTKELSKKDKRVAMKVKRFNTKSDPVAFLNQLDDEPFNPDYVEIDRVLDVSTYNDQVTGETVTHYLVKWVSLPYEDSTWELEMNVDEPKIAQYIELKKPPGLELRQRLERPQTQDWQKIDKSPIYKNNNELREYQLEGLNWLLFCWYKRQNCILADEMGLGKTIQSITFLCSIKKFGIRGPFLVIAPLSTISNWQREFETWSDINAIVYHGTAPSRHLIQQYEMYYREEKGEKIPDIFKFEAVITTYEMILSDNDILNSIPWRCLIIDEAHRLKNRNCKLLEGLNNLEVEHRVLLTGTPLQNNVEELFSLLNFLEPTRFPSQGAFLVEFGNLKTEAQVEKLQQILKPMMLRRLKEDVEKNIAPKEETIVEVELTTIQKKIYRAILEKNFAFLSKGASATNIPNLMNTMMELRKCCNHPFLINGAEERIVSEYTVGLDGLEKTAKQVKAMIESSGKMVLIDKLLPKLKAGGHKVLIFSQMIRVLDLIEDYLLTKRHAYERIDGRVRGNMRQAAIDRFCRLDSDRFVFLLCTRAGGLGINLTAADTVIIFDSDWNPQNDLQAQARCHRIGQEKSVKVYRLICRNTYEREMFDRASLKLGLDKAILQNINSKDGALGTPQQPAMSKKEIEDLLKKGAYGAIMDQEDSDASNKFCEEDIDLILERRTQIIKIIGEGKGSTFAKASFVSDKARLDVDIDDPDFWKKWAKKAAVDVEELCQDNLIIDKPRQRKQTRRFGNEDGPLDLSDFDSDEEGPKEEVPSRKSWTRVECFKVEKNLLVYGWGRWNDIITHGDFRLQMTEKEVEAIARSILAYCQHHFKGDEKTKQFIVSLIMSSAADAGVPLHTNDEAYVPTTDGKIKSKKRKRGKQPKKAQYSKPAIINVGNDWNAVDQESIVIDDGYRKHLIHHCNKILSRVRLLYCLWHDILGDESERIKKGCSASSIDFHVPYCDGEKPSIWWTDDCDKSLLIGVHKHGYERYSEICSDPCLYFAEKLGLTVSSEVQPLSPDSVSGENVHRNEDSNDPDFVSPKRKKKRPTGQDEDEDENSDDFNSDDEKESSVVGASPTSVSSKDASLEGVTKSGKQMPMGSDLNTRLRRLVASYQRSCEKEQLTQIKAEKDKERREKIAQQAKDREAKKAVMAQKWSRREESDFYKVISTFGVVYDPKKSAYDWTKFRNLARLDKKDDDRITAYYEEFMAMCRRMCGKPDDENKEGRMYSCVTPVTEERANRCLQRVHLLRKIREEILPHEQLDERLKLCQRSSEFPPWWENGTHDKELVLGVAKHGIGRTDYHLFTDPELSFKEILDSAGTRKDSKEDGANKSDLEKPEKDLHTTSSREDLDESLQNARAKGRNKGKDAGNDIALADLSEFEPDLGKSVKDYNEDQDSKSDLVTPTITDEAAEILSTWPKDRMVINRLEKITHCVLHGFWPKGVKSLDAAIAKLHSHQVPILIPNLPPTPTSDRHSIVSGEPMHSIDEEMKVRGDAEYAAGLNDKDFKIKRVSSLDGLKLTVKKHKKRKKKDIDYEEGALGKLCIVPPPETAFSSRTELRAEISEKLTKKILKRATLEEMLLEEKEIDEAIVKPKRMRRKRKANVSEPPDLTFNPSLVNEGHTCNEDLQHESLPRIKVPVVPTLHIPRVNSSDHKTLPGAAVQLDDALMLAAKKRGLIQVHYPKISKLDESGDKCETRKLSRMDSGELKREKTGRRASESDDDRHSPVDTGDTRHSHTRWKAEESDSPPAYPTSPIEVRRDITWKEILKGTSMGRHNRSARDPPVLSKAPVMLDKKGNMKDTHNIIFEESYGNTEGRVDPPPLTSLKQAKHDVLNEHDIALKSEPSVFRNDFSEKSDNGTAEKQEAKATKKECKRGNFKHDTEEEIYDADLSDSQCHSNDTLTRPDGRKKDNAVGHNNKICLSVVPPATVASKKEHRKHSSRSSPEASRILPRREASVEASRLITAQEKGYVLPKLQPAGYARYAKSPPDIKCEDHFIENRLGSEVKYEIDSRRRSPAFTDLSPDPSSSLSSKHHQTKDFHKTHSHVHGTSHVQSSRNSPKPKRVDHVKAGNGTPELEMVREKESKNYVIPKLSRTSSSSKGCLLDDHGIASKSTKEIITLDKLLPFTSKSNSTNRLNKQGRRKGSTKHLASGDGKDDGLQLSGHHNSLPSHRKSLPSDQDDLRTVDLLSTQKKFRCQRSKVESDSALTGQVRKELKERNFNESADDSSNTNPPSGCKPHGLKHGIQNYLSEEPVLGEKEHRPHAGSPSFEGMFKRRKQVDEMYPLKHTNIHSDKAQEKSDDLPTECSILCRTEIDSSHVMDVSPPKLRRQKSPTSDLSKYERDQSVHNVDDSSDVRHTVMQGKPDGSSGTSNSKSADLLPQEERVKKRPESGKSQGRYDSKAASRHKDDGGDSSSSRSVTLDIPSRPSNASSVSPSSTGRPKLKLDAIVAKLSTTATASKHGTLTSADSSITSSFELSVTSSHCGSNTKEKHLSQSNTVGACIALSPESSSRVKRTDSKISDLSLQTSSTSQSVDGKVDRSTGSLSSKGRKGQNLHKYSRDTIGGHITSDSTKRIGPRRETPESAPLSLHRSSPESGTKRTKRLRLGGVDDFIHDNFDADSHNLRSPHTANEGGT